MSQNAQKLYRRTADAALHCLGILFLAATLVGCSGAQQARNASTADVSVLVFSKTEGFRHASIEDGVAAVQKLGSENGFSVAATEDASEFTAGTLAGYDVVIFLNTTGDVLNETQQAAFEAFIRNGGGYVGVHSAADTEYDWEWYGGLVGAYFDSHPATQEADVAIVDPVFPATAHLPSRWTRTDEWYNYGESPRGDVHVVATVVENSYEGGEMGDDHPIAWAHEYDGGRAFYTGMGHTPESYQDPLYLEHLLGAINWAAGVVDADIAATLRGAYEEVVLEDDTTYPMQLQVADDGRVFWIERTGAFKIWDPASKSTIEAGYISVTDKIEDGLLGIELDPNFSENNWIYFFYTPISEDPNRLSRFTMDGNRLDLSSEIIMLEVRMQREACCHSAGELHFDHEGNLWLTTGDNTGGSAPRTDERPGREFYDAQRTTANTNDLRGKIMRITPQPDGSYTIPEGNLFEDDDPRTRPEIYTMGMRNPWRFFVDPATGWLFWGEVGPANQFQEGNAPLGNEEFNLAKGPGFFGWPYFNGPNGAYRDYNYETEEYGELPDPENPINDSPNNTGIRQLPPAQPSWIWYSYGPSEEFPEMGVGGMSASAGFRYHYDSAVASPRALPPYYDGKVFLFEWMRNWIQEVLIDDDGAPVEITDFTPEITYTRPVDIELGPNQELYVLEWGEEFWGQNRDGRLVRIDYYGSDERPPTVVASAGSTSGPAPLQVRYDASQSESRGDGSLSFAWDFDGNGTVDAETATATHTFTTPGSYTAQLTVTDSNGLTAEEEITVTVGNTAPEVSIAWPPSGGIVPFNEPVPFSVDVTDAEDGTIASPGPRVTLQPYLIHDTHEHPLHLHRGNEGTFNVVPDTSHAPYLIDEYIEVVASYTDDGGTDAPRLTSTDSIRLYPKVVQAEHYTDGAGISLSTTGSRQSPTWAQDTNVFLEVESDGFARFESMNLHGIDALVLSLVADAEGSVEVRLDGVDGRLLGQSDITPSETEASEETGERRRGPRVINWVDHRMEFDPPVGNHDLYVVFRGPEGEDVARFDRMRFEGAGVLAAPDAVVSASVW